MADHVFISYAREDQEFVLALAERLRARGVPVWLDQWSISPGETWERAIENALYECAYCLVVLSPASVRSDVILAEYGTALEEGKTVVPVLYQRCRVPLRLRPLHRVECRGRGAEDESLLGEMLAALGMAVDATLQAGGKAGSSSEVSKRLINVPPLDPALEAMVDAFHLGREALVRIPAGEFAMGSPEEEGGDDEHPQHTLTLPEFYLMRAPVTNAQYRLFIEAGGYDDRQWWTDAGWAYKEKEGWTEPRLWRDEAWNPPEHPVVGVSWYEALAFARWAGGTLPSEAEWEKAASWDPGAHRKRRYPWGDEWDGTRCNANEKDPGRTTPVGQYSPRGDSAYGLVDMAGNVWEWTRSQWGGYRYVPADGREDLAARGAREQRGGSWFNPYWNARCAYRDRDEPFNWSDHAGFRASVSLAFAGS